jgi:hypothetical protein
MRDSKKITRFADITGILDNYSFKYLKPFKEGLNGYTRTTSH